MASDVLLTLGTFKFSVDSAPYAELERRSSWGWAEQPRIGIAPALQFVGVEAEVFTFKGTIFPHYNKNPRALETLRDMAAKGIPYDMTSGTGVYIGRFAITDLRERGTSHLANGAARKLEFDLSLRKYDDGKQGLKGNIASASNSGNGVTPIA